MKRVYLGNTELTTIATRDTAGGGGGDDAQKWVDYFNGTLTEFTVPEGVTNVNNATFNTFTGLTSLTLPSSITSIDNIRMSGIGMPGRTNPFGTLKTMTVKATTPPSLVKGTIPSTIEAIYVPTASVDSYKSANNWSNYDDNIQAIPQNETVVIYNDGTYKEFSIIGELTNDKIENITAATRVYIGNSVTSIGDYGFQSCASLTDIAISNNVKIIGQYAFYYCSSLTGVTIPESVTSIGNHAFYLCDYLTNITISSNVTEIGDRAFNNCYSLESVMIKNSTSKLAYNTDVFGAISSTAKLYVPASVLSDYQADSNWTGAFGGGIYRIGTSMKVTYADSTNKTFYDLTTISSSTDSNIKNAKDVIIYYGVKKIDKQAFSSCTGLTNVEISDSVTNIDFAAFACSGLTSITIPDSVTNFGDSVLQRNPDLESVTLGSGINSLGVYVCYKCPKLASVTIRNSKNKITYGNGTFDDTPSSKKLYVPSNLLADYQADTNWTNAFKGGIFAIQ